LSIYFSNKIFKKFSDPPTIDGQKLNVEPYKGEKRENKKPFTAHHNEMEEKRIGGHLPAQQNSKLIDRAGDTASAEKLKEREQ
jgi:hypothetical protein